MKKNCTLLLTALALVSTPTLAQEGGDTARVRRAAPEKRDGPVLVQAPVGAAAAVLTRDDQRLGSFQDHVIDLVTGAVTFVVVKTPEASHVVPYSRFAWDEESKSLRLVATAEELAMFPAYDVEQLQKLDAFGDVAGRDVAGTREASAKDVEPLRNVTATQILGSPLFVEGAAFASMSHLLMEPSIGRINYVLANDAPATKTAPLILPWRALAWEMDAERKTGHFSLPLTKAELADAPRLEDSDPAKLGEREFVQTIREFYSKVTPMRGGAAVRLKGTRN